MLLSLLIACTGFVPSASLGELDVRSVDMQGAEAVVQVVVDNPWPVGAAVGADWSLSVDERVVASGVAPLGAVEASGSSTLGVPVRWRWADLWAVTGAGADAPYALSVQLHGSSAWGDTTLPLQVEGVLPGLRLPRFELLDWRVDELSLSRVAGTVTARVDLPVREVDWALVVGVVPLMHGRLERGEGELRLPVVLELGQGGSALLSAMQHGVGVRLDALLDSPLGELPLHYDARWP
jgi:hypothetical protein